MSFSVYNSRIPAGSKVLILAEKPSMARDIASVLGVQQGKKNQNHIEVACGWVVWAVGHLLQLAQPSSYPGKQWRQWSWENLPIVPDGFSFLYEIKSTEDGKSFKAHLDHIASLYKKADILVNACDAGREGELICWEILRYCGWGKDLPPGVPGEKPLLRFWAQSNTPEGLREAWNGLFPIQDRPGLPLAAYCRSEADWLLGMNGSRAVSLAFPLPQIVHKGKKSRGIWSVGRVQTPVLALVVDRDESIDSFASKPFYEVRLTFPGHCSEFEATLLVPKGCQAFYSDQEENTSMTPSTTSKAFLHKEEALGVLDKILSLKKELWKVQNFVKSGIENPPALFSLTDLQKWCNVNWGWDAKRTLDAAQAAYEEDKTLTYPRTDSAFLPEDSRGKMDSVFSDLLSFLSSRLDQGFVSGLVKPSQSPRAGYLFNDKKLTDHYAIAPTGVVPKNLDSDAGKVWLAVIRRFLVAFAPPARYSQVRRELSLSDYRAVCSGKIYTDPGWLQVDQQCAPLTGAERRSQPATVLPECDPYVPLLDGHIHAGKTTPPKRLTEATLLSLMENIHTKIDASEEALKEAIAGKGLGTPSTRAAIIETLLSRGYIERVKSKGAIHILSTESGRTLIRNLREVGCQFIASPVLTAEWETKLVDMEKNKGIERVSFLRQLCQEIEKMIKILSNASMNTGGVSPVKELSVKCPFSGKPIKDAGSYWIFPGLEDRRFYKKIAGREFSLEEMILILKGQSPVFDGFLSKESKPFSAALALDRETGKLSFVFPERKPEQTSFLCPSSGKPVVDHGSYWIFPGYPNTRFWKTMAGRTMSLEDYCAILKGGVFLDGFVSKKSGRNFSARVIYKDDQVVFDFDYPSAPTTPKMSGPGSSKMKRKTFY